MGCFASALIGTIVLVLVLGLGTWAFRVATAELKGRGDAHIEINSGANRIAQYEHFFDLCVSVQNAETGLDAENARLKETTDPHMKGIIQTNISGLIMTRQHGINTYNADATKNYTSGQFLASNLPYQLSTEPYVVGGPKTQCAV
jgi:hypothetical protein